MILHRKAFYIMRHGQTTDNAAGMISGGGRDPHLTDLGREQAQEAAAIFAKLNPAPTRIVVSALIRTHQTAALVCGHSNHVIDARLNERYLGPMDGTINEEQQKALGVLPGEESSAAQALRVLEALNHHLDGDETILFVCHGGTVRRILEAAGVRDKFNVPNATIYAVLPDNAGWAFHAPA